MKNTPLIKEPISKACVQNHNNESRKKNEKKNTKQNYPLVEYFVYLWRLEVHDIKFDCGR